MCEVGAITTVRLCVYKRADSTTTNENAFLPFVQSLREYFQFLPSLVEKQNLIFDFSRVDLVGLIVFHECLAFVDHVFHILTVIRNVFLENLK